MDVNFSRINWTDRNNCSDEQRSRRTLDIRIENYHPLSDNRLWWRFGDDWEKYSRRPLVEAPAAYAAKIIDQVHRVKEHYRDRDPWPAKAPYRASMELFAESFSPPLPGSGAGTAQWEEWKKANDHAAVWAAADALGLGRLRAATDHFMCFLDCP